MSLLVKTFLILSLLVSAAWAGVDADGVDDGMTCGTAISDAGPLTIAFWMNADTLGELDRGRTIELLGGAQGFVVFRLNATNSIKFSKNFVTEDLSIITNTNVYSQDTWTHVAVTWDGGATAANVDIYINGVEVAGYTEQIDGSGAEQTGTQTTTFFGGAGSTNDFNGTIDEAAIWGVELTAEEVLMLASSRTRRMPLQIQPSSLISYWPLDDEEDGSSADADTFRDYKGTNTCTGDNGANNTGLVALAGAVSSYP